MWVRSGAIMCTLVMQLAVVQTVEASFVDYDGDGLSDDQETAIYFSDPHMSDTDGDGYTDGEEISNNFSPLVAFKKLEEVDSDSDGLNDKVELALGTSLWNKDSDGDGFQDGEEAFAGYNPLRDGRDRSLLKHVEVNLTSQQISYFLNDVKLGTMPVSTGLIKWATPNGEFKVLRKVPVKRYIGDGYDYPNTRWNIEFKRSYYIHEAYWHNQFGIRPMSHGCVNMAGTNVEKLYTFLDVGDKVKVSGKTPTRVVKK